MLLTLFSLFLFLSKFGRVLKIIKKTNHGHNQKTALSQLQNQRFNELNYISTLRYDFVRKWKNVREL